MQYVSGRPRFGWKGHGFCVKQYRLGKNDSKVVLSTVFPLDRRDVMDTHRRYIYDSCRLCSKEVKSYTRRCEVSLFAAVFKSQDFESRELHRTQGKDLIQVRSRLNGFHILLRIVFG